MLRGTENGSVVRQIVGSTASRERSYRRCGVVPGCAAVWELLPAFGEAQDQDPRWEPSEAHVRRRGHTLSEATCLRCASAEERERLEAIYSGLDPVLLLRQIEILQEALWRHAVLGGVFAPVALPCGHVALTDGEQVPQAGLEDDPFATVRFDPKAGVPADGTAPEETTC